MNFNINDRFKLWINGTLYNYNMKREAYAWQLPSFDASLGMSYNMAEKLNIRLQTYAAGDRFQRIYAPTEKSKKLAPYIDVNLLADYRYKKNVSFFLQVGNITNGRYQQWYQYPVFGLNGLLGVTFSL
jgi:outer membrane cobalamin receptor